MKEAEPTPEEEEERAQSEKQNKLRIAEAKAEEFLENKKDEDQGKKRKVFVEVLFQI